MKKIVLVCCLFTLISSFAFAEQPVRFSCTEAQKLSLQAGRSLQRILARLIQKRDLASMSLDPSLGQTDRNYLQDEFNAVSSELNRLIQQERYTDSFSQSFFYLKDGFTFTTLVQSKIGGEEFPMDFTIEPLSFQAAEDAQVVTREKASIAYDVLEEMQQLIRLRQAEIGMIIEACPP